MINIRIWKFSDAPEQYRKLSGHGGDEDWIAKVGPYPLADQEQLLISGDHGLFGETGSLFAVSSIEDHALPEIPFHIFIGSHV